MAASGTGTTRREREKRGKAGPGFLSTFRKKRRRRRFARSIPFFSSLSPCFSFVSPPIQIDMSAEAASALSATLGDNASLVSEEVQKP